MLVCYFPRLSNPVALSQEFLCTVQLVKVNNYPLKSAHFHFGQSVLQSFQYICSTTKFETGLPPFLGINVLLVNTIRSVSTIKELQSTMPSRVYEVVCIMQNVPDQEKLASSQALITQVEFCWLLSTCSMCNNWSPRSATGYMISDQPSAVCINFGCIL